MAADITPDCSWNQPNLPIKTPVSFSSRRLRKNPGTCSQRVLVNLQYDLPVPPTYSQYNTPRRRNFPRVGVMLTPTSLHSYGGNE